MAENTVQNPTLHGEFRVLLMQPSSLPLRIVPVSQAQDYLGRPPRWAKAAVLVFNPVDVALFDERVFVSGRYLRREDLTTLAFESQQALGEDVVPKARRVSDVRQQSDGALPPCPFCGGAAYVSRDDTYVGGPFDYGPFYTVACGGCAAEAGWRKEQASAERMWQMRVAPGPELARQISGYWFGPDEPVSSVQPGQANGIVLPPLDVHLLPGVQAACLSLMAPGFGDPQGWRFVPVASRVLPWPTIFEASDVGTVAHGDLAKIYGTEADQAFRGAMVRIRLSHRSNE